MNHKQKVFLSVIGVCILFSACKSPEEMSATTDSTPGVTQAIFETDETDVLLETDVEILCEKLERVDASEFAKYNPMNRLVWNDGEKRQSSLFCIDESTGVVYFINQGKDFFLYRMKDGKAELAVALPAKEIYTYEGKVYFMIESYERYDVKEKNDGDIYCYIPEKGTIELIYEAGKDETMKQHRLTVNENGVFFRMSVPGEMELDGETVRITTTMHYQVVSESEEPITDLNYTASAGWNEYLFAEKKATDSSKIVVCLINRILGAEDVIELPFEKGGKYCAVENDVYYLGRTALYKKNMVTGEIDVIDFWEEIKECHVEFTEEEIADIEKGKDNRVLLEYFSVTERGKSVWVAESNVLYHWDLETGECTSYVAPHISGEFLALYTDGVQLYANYDPSRSGNGLLVRVKEEQQEKDMLGRYIAVLEELTE